jgi:hypothetical protein
MSVSNGLNYIIDNSLLFNFDLLNNKKSFIGESTTNLFGSNLSATTATKDLYLGSYRGTYRGWQTTGIANDNPRTTLYNSTLSVNASTYYTLSCLYWSSNDLLDDVYLKFSDAGWPESTTYIQPFSSQSVTRNGSFSVTSLGDGWRYCVGTFQTLATTTTLEQLFFDNDNTGIVVFITNIQLEQKSYATPFVAGTRSSSQAILDLTGNETITINGSPTYNTNSITIPNVNTAFLDVTPTTPFRMGTSNFTLSCWIKQIDNGANVIVEARDTNLLGYLWVLNYPSTGQITIFLNHNSSQQSYQSTVSTLPAGSIQNITTVVDRANNNIKHYLNGVLWDTVTGVHTNSISGTTGEMYRIGYDRGGSTQNFEIYQYSHFNRALTAAEILQNFNAYKGKFGL